MADSAVAYATAPYEKTSPTLLAQQPPTDPSQLRLPSEDWQSIYQHLESRLQALRNWRYSWWAFWSVLAAFFIPYRYIWVVTANRMWRGSNINNQIINSKGVTAVRTCSAGLWTGLCSPSRPWFKYGRGSDWAKLSGDAREWCEDVEAKLYELFEGSNFYQQMRQCFDDLVVFGTGVNYMLEDFEDGLRFYVPCAGEYYLGVGSRFAPDTLFREFTLTVLQIVDMFQIDNCPNVIKTEWSNGNYDTEYVVAHAIEPNFAIKKRGKGSTGRESISVVPQVFPYREVYWLRSSQAEREFSRKGFRDIIPFMAFRWMTVGNDAYGRSPCMDAIGDNKQIQLEDLRKAEYIEKGVRPPMGAEPALKNEPASTMPGMTTYVSTEGSKKGFWPLFQVGAEWVKVLADDVKNIEQRIDHCLYVDLFMAISRMEGVQPRNELELTKRDLERLQELGPVINMAEEQLELSIQRGVEVLTKRGVIKPKPKSLEGVALKTSFVSILRLAQRSAESVAMKDVFQTAGGLSSAAKAAGVPDPIRIINLDEAFRHYMEINNFPEEAVFSEDQVSEHDKIRTQQLKQAQAPQNAMAGVTAAKTLSETALPGGGSALGALMGGGGGAPQ